MMKVAGSGDSAVYLEGGKLAAATIRKVLVDNRVPLPTLRRILDFGCGRVLRQWKDLTTAEIHGTDYNPELAGWCARNLPFATVQTNTLAPPTKYPDGHFDLIYALSVLTHLPETEQAGWMTEFRRLLAPGGLLLVTTHGQSYLGRLSDPERERFLQGKLVVRFVESAGTNLCNAYHAEAYVRQYLARGFEVINFVVEGARGNPRQDLWLLQRIAG